MKFKSIPITSNRKSILAALLLGFMAIALAGTIVYASSTLILAVGTIANSQLFGGPATVTVRTLTIPPGEVGGMALPSGACLQRHQTGQIDCRRRMRRVRRNAAPRRGLRGSGRPRSPSQKLRHGRCRRLQHVHCPAGTANDAEHPEQRTSLRPAGEPRNANLGVGASSTTRSVSAMNEIAFWPLTTGRTP